MTVADILNKAADLIEPEGAWTQRWYAKTEHGRFADPKSEKAVCWCAVGALQLAAGDDLNGYYDAKNVLSTHLQSRAAQWNDAPERTQAEVVQKLREAALLAHREKGQP